MLPLWFVVLAVMTVLICDHNRARLGALAADGNHHDYFAADYYESVEDDMVNNVGKGGNRLATMLWYLDSPTSGGETHFPCALDDVCLGGEGIQGYPVPKYCDSAQKTVVGVKVPPKPGLATLFYSLRPDGAPDGFSLHAGCPPEGSGSKWAVNKCELSAAGAAAAAAAAAAESYADPYPEVAAACEGIWNQPWSPQSRSKPKHFLHDHHNFFLQLDKMPDSNREVMLKRAIKDLAAAAAANPIVAADPKTEQATHEYTSALERWTKFKRK